MRQPTPENEVIGRGGKYSWGALAYARTLAGREVFFATYTPLRKTNGTLFHRNAVKLCEVFDKLKRVVHRRIHGSFSMKTAPSPTIFSFFIHHA